MFTYLLILCLSLTPVFAQKNKKLPNEAWGQLIKVEKENRLFGHEYFIYFKRGDKEVAYPISTKDAQLQKKMKKMNREFVKVKGKVRVEEVYRGEFKDKIIVFEIHGLDPLKMQALAPKDKSDTYLDRKPPEAPGQQKSEGGLKVHDDIAHSVIYGAGAILAGSVISQLLNNQSIEIKPTPFK